VESLVLLLAIFLWQAQSDWNELLGLATKKAKSKPTWNKKRELPLENTRAMGSKYDKPKKPVNSTFTGFFMI
jgi:hypothetical protein